MARVGGKGVGMRARVRSDEWFDLDVADQSHGGGWSRKSASRGPMLPAVLLMMRYWPPPMLAGAWFQKPSERLLTKDAASSADRTQTRLVGTIMESLQLTQNLFLK